MRAKGLREIKTSTGRQSSRPMKIHWREISSLSATQHPVTTNKIKADTPRTWVFIAEPKFSRFHKNLLVDRYQEPNTEIFKEAESVIVIADIPGVMGEENTKLSVEGDVLIIEAMNNTPMGKRKYFKELVLPFLIDASKMSLFFNNGLMEVTLFPVTQEVKND